VRRRAVVAFLLGLILRGQWCVDEVWRAGIFLKGPRVKIARDRLPPAGGVPALRGGPGSAGCVPAGGRGTLMGHCGTTIGSNPQSITATDLPETRVLSCSRWLPVVVDCWPGPDLKSLGASHAGSSPAPGTAASSPAGRRYPWLPSESSVPCSAIPAPEPRARGRAGWSTSVPRGREQTPIAREAFFPLGLKFTF